MEILLACDDWDRDSLTEKQVYLQLSSYSLKNQNVCYFAFPWSTFLEKKKNGIECEILLEKIEKFKRFIEDHFYLYVITACQHEDYETILSIAENIGITDIFCCKIKNKADISTKINIYPLPVYTQSRKNNHKSITYTYIPSTGAQTLSRHICTDFHKYNINKRQDNYNQIDKIFDAKYTAILSQDESLVDYVWLAIANESIPILHQGYLYPKHERFFSSFAIIVHKDFDLEKNIESLIKKDSDIDYERRLENIKAYNKIFQGNNLTSDIVHLILSIKDINPRDLNEDERSAFELLENCVNKKFKNN